MWFRKFVLWCLALVLAVAMLELSTNRIDAESFVETPTSLTVMQSVNSSAFYWKPGGLWRVDSSPRRESFFFAYDPPPNHHVVDLELDLVAGKLYVIEGEGASYYTSDNWNEKQSVIQIDLQSQYRKVLWQEVNLWDLSLSPSGSWILLRFSDEISAENHYRPASQYCVLEIQEQTCAALHVSGTNLHWEGENTLIYTSRRNSNVIEFISAQGFTGRELYVSHLVRIAGSPNISGLLGLFIKEQKVVFAIIDLKTGKVSKVPHQSRIWNIWRMGISPNGERFYYSAENTLVAVNVRDGIYFVATISNPAGELWFPDSNALLVLARAEDTTERIVYEVVYFDIQAGGTYSLNQHIIDAGNRILLVPYRGL